MSGTKKCLAALLILLILAAAAAGVLWHWQHYRIVDWKIYPRDAEVLDLRDREISIAHYEHIHQALPASKILWNVPFQGNAYSEGTQVLQVTELTGADLDVLACFPELKTVDARGCTDYAQLLEIQKQYPQIEVMYTVSFCGRDYEPTADTVYGGSVTWQDLENLTWLPQLKQVCLEDDENPEILGALIEYCREKEITVHVALGSQFYPDTAGELTLDGVGEEEIAMLSWFPALERLHLTNPRADAQTLRLLQAERPEVTVTWEKEVLGTLYRSDTEVIDLSEALSPDGAAAIARAAKASIHGEHDEEVYLFAISDDFLLPDKTEETVDLITRVEEELAYFPDLQKVLLCGSLLDNEVMSAFREDRREDYQVVWTVQCGEMAVRTDSPYFMPTKYHVYYFHDEDAVNLRYCEDMISVDLGHMTIRKIDWVEYMPNLTYLVLAHSDIRSIEPIRSCKKLKFLELDWSAVQDYSPLTDCTALEDLNLGNTGRKIDSICEMTWLKHLWMVGCPEYSVARATQALPDTTIMGSGSATVANGWRELPNYCAMRDVMNMYYMPWD